MPLFYCGRVGERHMVLTPSPLIVRNAWLVATTLQTTLKKFGGDHYFMFSPENVKAVCEYIDGVMNGGEPGLTA